MINFKQRLPWKGGLIEGLTASATTFQRSIVFYISLFNPDAPAGT
jgi:hypothetical protein